MRCHSFKLNVPFPIYDCAKLLAEDLGYSSLSSYFTTLLCAQIAGEGFTLEDFEDLPTRARRYQDKVHDGLKARFMAARGSDRKPRPTILELRKIEAEKKLVAIREILSDDNAFALFAEKKAA